MKRIVVVGGGAAGIGAAGAARQTDRSAGVRVYTDFEDVGYSPCGIPYVHGREIPDFPGLILQSKEFYEQSGLDIHYTTTVTEVEPDRGQVIVAGEGAVPYDSLVLATGFEYEPPGVPGSDLEGLYYVKNIRRAMEWDEILDEAKRAVVVDATPLGLEMATALAHRKIETHFVDPHPWLLSEVGDPDILKPVEDSLIELGVQMHLRTRVEAFLGNGRLEAVKTSEGDIPADVAVVCTPKRPNNVLARAAGVAIGSTGGIVVDEKMATSRSGVWACGDCVELPHAVTRIPVQGLTGSHAYAQGKVAGANAAGGDRAYHPVYVPWGMAAGKWMIGGVSFGETLATALGIPFVMGVGEGISRARYFPGAKKIRVKLLAEPDSLRLIGAQIVGGEGVKERADFLGMAVYTGISIPDLAWMENVYSPAIGALNEPIALAAQDCLARLGR
ncbi:MAG: FAD-dependent oxidoreductase [Candidatus Dormibacteraeota bacterium]|jgi:NADH oxidase (H2O2-forming)|nr:FAD-dependent oxidoreductase [Candidatus Dormibacteraeota bacterium]